jgi:hypothetical protein
MRMPYTRLEIAKHAERIGRSGRTLRRWVVRGCNLDDPRSVEKFLAESERKKPNAERYRQRRGGLPVKPKAQHRTPARDSGAFEQQGNGKVAGTPGRRGAAGTLERLEATELQAYRRLQATLEHGDQFQISAAEDFWLKCSEALRRLDLAVELARRDAEEMVPKRLACDVALAIADWLRISFAVFLSSETLPLMGLRSPGEFKHYAFERFRSILHLTIGNSLSTRSPIPDWAAEKVKESWNVPGALNG